MSAGDLCESRFYEDLGWVKSGRVVLERDRAGPEACPSYGGGLFICGDCVEIVGEFMDRAYDARAVRMEHRIEEVDFELEGGG
jgi:hypothetical protein